MKKGFELSISFIVVIVLAVVLLILGIVLLNTFIGGAGDIKKDLDEQTDRQLTELLEGGKQIVLPFNRQTISRGDSHIFGIGILNIGNSGTFSMKVTNSTAVQKDGVTPIQDYEIDADDWFRYDKETFLIDENEQRKDAILAEVPKNAPAGTYVFNVYVSKDGSQYDVVKKLYITIR
ncbi:hypothetical protein ACFLZB_00270 [Nanoarchaeota archaeon]